MQYGYIDIYEFVIGEQTALLTVAPLDQIVKKGTIAHFDCVYKNADTVEWYFKDVGPLIASERYYSCSIFQ